MTTLQDRLEHLAGDLVIKYIRPETYPEVLLKQAVDTLDQAEQIIQRLLLRVQVGDSAAIEAKKFLERLK